MKYIIPALRFKIFMTILLGLVYPLTMTGISQWIFPKQSHGDLVSQGGVIVGSQWLSQKFQNVNYFWSRPSVGDYNPLPSGGSNLGPTSQDLKKIFEERKSKLQAAHPEQKMDPPQDLLFASASGLDPHISLQAAFYQAQRVAQSRHMSIDQVNQLIRKATEGRSLGFLGEPRVHVLSLNLSLDQFQDLNHTFEKSTGQKPEVVPTQE